MYSFIHSFTHLLIYSLVGSKWIQIDENGLDLKLSKEKIREGLELNRNEQTATTTITTTKRETNTDR